MSAYRVQAQSQPLVVVERLMNFVWNPTHRTVDITKKWKLLSFFVKFDFLQKKMFAKKQVPINFIDKIFENMRNLKVVDENPFEKSWIFISKSGVTPSQNAKSFRWMSKTSFQGIRSNSNSFSKLWNSLVPTTLLFIINTYTRLFLWTFEKNSRWKKLRTQEGNSNSS